MSVVPNVRPMRASVVRAWYTAMSEVTSPWMTADVWVTVAAGMTCSVWDMVIRFLFEM